MLRATCRRLIAQKLIVAIFLALAIFYLLCSLLSNINQGAKIKKRLAYLSSPRMQLQQHGDYWVYNNFLTSQCRELTGNESITLTTHGTFRDFKYMKWLLARWSGPISMSVFVQLNDMNRTQQYLYYIKYCTSLSMSFAHYVSLHLVFPDKHMPRAFEKMSNKRPKALRCKTFMEIFKSVRKKYPTNFTYPLHLLKNVARLNAETFYVLPLDPGMLPTKYFITSFQQFAYYYHPAKPFKSVYCIPVCPQVCDDSFLPKYKSQLVHQLVPYLDGKHTLFGSDQEHLEDLRPWLLSPVRDGDITIYNASKEPRFCAVYVSSNAFDPFHDERHIESIYDMDSTKLQVMVGLGFDFIVLDGTFLINRNSSLHQEYTTVASDPHKQEHIQQLIKLNSFVLDN